MEHLLKMKSRTIKFRDPVVENVVDKFVSRSDVGFAKYFKTPKFPFGEDAYQAYYDTLNKRATLNGSMEYMKTDNRFQLIRDWAGERGLYTRGDTKTQFCKLMEEAGELGRAILKNDQAEFVDAIGDMVVVLTNLAKLGDTSIEYCTDSAYDVISRRTGKMVNGTFVKDTL